MGSQYEIQGQTVDLPVVVRDASSGTVMYMVDRDAARKIIPPEFEADEVAPGRTQLGIVMVDYRDNDLGDYDEVGIIFFVRPKEEPEAEVGSYIHYLPVNQGFTQEAGCTIWGFPKTVEEIHFSTKDDSATCRLEMEGRHVLTLTLPRGGDAETPETPALGYTLLHGAPHRVAFSRGGKGELTTPGGQGVVLELGDHPISNELRSLGLPDLPPLLSSWSEHFYGTFGEVEKV
ncbi:MAG: acetoacetate decarboxylase family protein [Myxococcota bacterium]|nr:acetoacetate decarboxylase family protein [Myxococcota bacterium]